MLPSPKIRPIRFRQKVEATRERGVSLLVTEVFGDDADPNQP